MSVFILKLQVRHLIQQEINNIHFKLFDDKLKELNERIGKTHCKIRHDTKATELFVSFQFDLNPFKKQNLTPSEIKYILNNSAQCGLTIGC